MTEKETLFYEINMHLTEDKNPSKYLDHILKNPLFNKYPFQYLAELNSTKQSPKYHPEGNVWKHTMLVVTEAARMRDKSKDMGVFMWAALLHDIGKPATTRERHGKITSYNHDKKGEELAREFLKSFKAEQIFIDKAASLVRWHMQMFYVTKDMPFANIEAMKKEVDIDELALLGWCDRMGRTNANEIEIRKSIDNFIKKCKESSGFNC